MTRLQPAERADSAANRTRIIDAASDVFGRRGLDAEVKEIAAAAGVGVGTIYRHFANRDELLRALVAQTSDDLRTRLETAIAAEDPRDGLRDVIRIGVGTYARLGALMELAIAARLRPYLPAGHDDFHELLVGLFERGIRSGVFRADLDPAVALSMLRSVLMSGQVKELAAERGYEATAAGLSAFMLHACGADPAP